VHAGSAVLVGVFERLGPILQPASVNKMLQARGFFRLAVRKGFNFYIIVKGDRKYNIV
jgi:hypothetical protein